jgi:hypothetical protein
MMYESDVDLIHVQQQLVEHFDLGELKTLCFQLGIDDEAIAGETKPDKSRELVKYTYRNGRIPDLLVECQKLRPKVDWYQPAKIYKRDELPDDWVEPLQRLYRLAREFNRNRHQLFTEARTRQGDEIAFTMREAAPFLFGQFDVKAWLNSSSTGKRLAAVKYLDWLQDIEFLDNLLAKLATESPFMQLHILTTIDSMLDQLDKPGQALVSTALTAYQIRGRDTDREYWRKRILERLGSGESDSSA